MPLTYSPLESKRFNLRIYRGTEARLDVEALRHTTEQEQLDVAILRLPTSEQHRLWELQALPRHRGRNLVRFDLDMRVSPPPPMRNVRLHVRRATAADEATLGELVDLSFASYHTHYHGVQRAWVREGYLPTRSYVTLHLNALLGQR